MFCVLAVMSSRNEPAIAFRLNFLDNIPQDAYGTLSDPAKRREYDSVDEFDDSLPLECASTDFFKV
jgi:hypothetical protein